MGHDLPEQWEKESDPDPQKKQHVFQLNRFRAIIVHELVRTWFCMILGKMIKKYLKKKGAVWKHADKEPKLLTVLQPQPRCLECI